MENKNKNKKPFWITLIEDQLEAIIGLAVLGLLVGSATFAAQSDFQVRICPQSGCTQPGPPSDPAGSYQVGGGSSPSGSGLQTPDDSQEYQDQTPDEEYEQDEKQRQTEDKSEQTANNPPPPEDRQEVDIDQTDIFPSIAYSNKAFELEIDVNVRRELSNSRWVIVGGKTFNANFEVLPGDGSRVTAMIPKGALRAGEYQVELLDPEGMVYDTGKTIQLGRASMDYVWVSQTEYPILQRGERATLKLHVRNTGTAAWHQDELTVLSGDGASSGIRLATIRPKDRESNFQTDSWTSPNRPTKMEQEEVEPGEIATFVFDIEVPVYMSDGRYREYFGLVDEYSEWLPDKGIYWEIVVEGDKEMHSRIEDQPWKSDNPSVTSRPDVTIDRMYQAENQGPMAIFTTWIGSLVHRVFAAVRF